METLKFIKHLFYHTEEKVELSKMKKEFNIFTGIVILLQIAPFINMYLDYNSIFNENFNILHSYLHGYIFNAYFFGAISLLVLLLYLFGALDDDYDDDTIKDEFIINYLDSIDCDFDKLTKKQQKIFKSQADLNRIYDNAKPEKDSSTTIVPIIIS